MILQGKSCQPIDKREIKIVEAGKVITGKTPSKKFPEDWGNEMLFVTPSDYKNYRKFAYSSDRRLSNEGVIRLRNKVLPIRSVMVTCIGSDMGKVAMNKIQAITNQQINSIIPYRKVVDPNFLYYYLVSIYDLLRVYGTAGTAVPILNKTDFEQIKILLPALPEQKAISHILGTLDDKIELNRRMNETLEAVVRALFKSWFIDFDPVRTKMEGRDTELPQHIADLFPDRLVDTELGETPKGWVIGQISDIAVSTQRGVNPVDLVNDTPYIGLEHMPRHSIELMDWGTSNNVTSQKSIFNKGDILFGKLRPYFHKVGIAPVDGICSTDIVVMAPKDMEWFSYLLSCISSREFVGHADSISTGTKMPRTNWKAMSRYKLCMPNIPVVLVFQNIALPMLNS